MRVGDLKSSGKGGWTFSTQRVSSWDRMYTRCGSGKEVAEKRLGLLLRHYLGHVAELCVLVFGGWVFIILMSRWTGSLESTIPDQFHRYVHEHVQS